MNTWKDELIDGWSDHIDKRKNTQIDVFKNRMFNEYKYYWLTEMNERIDKLIDLLMKKYIDR